jgi:predicted phosphodiesterase
MEILVIGDLHIKYSRRDAFTALFNQVKYVLENRQVGHVVILGDVLHNHDKVSVFDLAMIMDLINMIRIKMPLTILVGNHDMINNQVYCSLKDSWMVVLEHVPNVEIIFEPRRVKMLGLETVCMPYVYPGKFYQALEEYKIQLDKSVQLVFAHQEFLGSEIGGKKSTCGDEYVSDQVCYSGHLHHFHKVGKVTYTGSAYEQSYGSSKCWIFCINARTMEETKIASNVRSLKIVPVTLKDGHISTRTVADKNTKYIVECSSDSEYKTWLMSPQGKELSASSIVIRHVPIIVYDRDVQVITDCSVLFEKKCKKKMTGEDFILISHVIYNT